MRDATRDALRACPDIGRALGRLAAGRGGPRDLGAIRDGLAVAVALKAALAGARALDTAAAARPRRSAASARTAR